MHTLSEIKNILIIGCGTLGLRIGLACALKGYSVKLYDINEDIFSEAMSTQQRILKQLLKSNLINEDQIKSAIKAMVWTTDPEKASADVDLVSESVTENRELKEQVWRQFGDLCVEKTIFTTNTSYLLPSMFADISGRPAKFCALHFHDVFHAKVVDIMPHSGTATWMIPLLTEFGRSIDQIPVVVEQESPGYIFNAMLMSVLGAAGALVTFNITSIENVDKSWMGNFKMNIGPFGMLDEIGLDTAWHVVKERKDPKSKKFAELLANYIDDGKLGMKTGEGFYKYPNPSYKSSNFLQ